MSIQSRQALRMIKFIAEMKKNNFPNAGSFTKLLRQIDINENIPCACSPRTVMRDIDTLQRDFNAPIAYDATQRGYYLTNPCWKFQAPILDDDILSMSILGTKLAGDILPDPIKSEVNHAVEKTLTDNSSEFFDEATISSLICATSIKAEVDPSIFKAVFDGWRGHRVLNLSYRPPNQDPVLLKFEPHIIAFRNGVWYAKGYEYGTKNVRTYAIQRILSVSYGIDCFETDRGLLEDTKRNGLFDFPKISGVRVLCDASIAFYLHEHQKAKKFVIEKQENGSLILSFPPCVEHDVIRWILGEAGHVEVLNPPELRQKVADAAKRIYDRNSTVLHLQGENKSSVMTLENKE